MLKTFTCALHLRYIVPPMGGFAMPSPRTTNLNLRISPEVREGLKQAAELDHRSISNMVEYLIIEHCEKKRIEIQRLPTK